MRSPRRHLPQLAATTVAFFGSVMAAHAADDLSAESITAFLKDLAAKAIQYVLVVAAIFIILAGYRFMTSFGNQSRLNQAKEMLLYIVIGVLVVLGAYLSVNALLAQLGK